MDGHDDAYRVRIAVRGYELDTQGHLNQAVYLQYGEHARWECLRAAGVSQDALLATGYGPVVLETTIRYRRELRAGDEVDVTCLFVPGEGKTMRFEHELRLLDGTVSAEILGVAGMLDLTERRLVPEPHKHFLALTDNPAVLLGGRDDPAA